MKLFILLFALTSMSSFADFNSEIITLEIDSQVASRQINPENVVGNNYRGYTYTLRLKEDSRIQEVLGSKGFTTRIAKKRGDCLFHGGFNVSNGMLTYKTYIGIDQGRNNVKSAVHPYNGSSVKTCLEKLKEYYQQNSSDLEVIVVRKQ